MHGGAGEERKGRQQRRMWQGPGAGAVAAAEVDSKQGVSDFFVKNGRKIQVGECALFRAGNAPPFIGLVRWFNSDKDGYLKLGVNWLYRPADIKLPKGVQLEAAPNEVFYSFHRDKIPAASLLHPCKVAFLQKGVELPLGISSFVCRRVYDIASKCLWWLTDQDYIDERQSEVDQLLDRTRLEMHAAVQSGGRSPKPSNGSASTHQLKSVSDSVQNSGTSFPSQVKVKKRERNENEPIKRERSLKAEDGDSVSSKLDNMIKAEIAKITEKGRLMNVEAVEKLVQLMQLDRAERKLDLGGRVLLADVISATDRLDCLSRFVQLRGVSIFDEWLQEAHRGKAGDGSSPKESDKSVEELLLALLRALDKLPVNLSALQTCNIGKSVNQLRSHKNLEIQKKARSLVETWKKRVDAEMSKINDAKSSNSCQTVSWPVKQGFTEVSHTGTKRPAPTELVMKGPITQPSGCKTLPCKAGHVDAIIKSSPAISGPLKLSPLPTPVSNSSKDTLTKAAGGSGISEVPLTTAKEEKSSSSGQSQNNSQSCSGDQVKALGWKDDARNLTSGTLIPCKTSANTSRHRRSNGYAGTPTSGAQKEANLGKPGSLNRTMTMDKVTQSGLTCERQPDVAVSDHGNNHRLIVRLPNPGRSPARSASGGSFEDPVIAGSRGSSPGVPDKIDHTDRRVKAKVETCIDGKEGSVDLDEDVKSEAATAEEDQCGNADGGGKLGDVSRTSSSSLGNEKEGFLHEAKIRNSFSSMNALVESCANEASALSAGDDIGMNLLASVAAGEMSEMSKTDFVSSTGSPGRSPAMGDAEAKPRPPCEDPVAESHSQHREYADNDSVKHEKVFASTRDGLQDVADNVSVDAKNVKLSSENKPTVDAREVPDGDGTNQYGDDRKAAGQAGESIAECKTKVKSLVVDENKSIDSVAESMVVDGTSDMGDKCDVKDPMPTKDSEVSVEDSACPNSKDHIQKQGQVDGGTGNIALTEQQPLPNLDNHSDVVDRSGDASVSSFGADHPEKFDDSKAEKLNCLRGRSPLEPGDGEKKEQANLGSSTSDDRPQSMPAVKVPEKILERKEAADNCPVESTKVEASSAIPANETEQSAKSTGSKISGPNADRSEEPSSTDASLAVSNGPECTSKIDFDLNEGIPVDDGHQSEPVSMPTSVCSSAIHLPGLSHFAPSPMANCSPAPITVAAPAKGPFVPPENLLKTKAEPGWKGSAATSAFRPAEPRKVLEMPLSTSDAPSSDNNAGKQSRPALDIDLNVPGERILEDMASQSSEQTIASGSGAVNNRDAPSRMVGGLDLDLNRVVESSENGIFLANPNRRLEAPLMPVRAAQAGLPNGDANSLRDFDLNGPGIDEAGTEPGIRNQQVKGGGLPLLPPIAGLRMNNTELGNVSAWFPPGNSYPAVAIPSFLHDRGEHPYPVVAAPGVQRISGPVTGSSTYGADIYRPVLSSSPAMAFSHTTSFPYAGFPFGSSFPVASNSFTGGPATYGDNSAGAGPCFPAIPQMMGAGPISSHYPRPYVIGLPESSTSGGSESSRKWAMPSLDLNAGPGSADAEARDERLSSAPRQLSIAGSQAFMEEQARMYQMSGGSLKRKEPEGGWDTERFAYKQPSWQ